MTDADLDTLDAKRLDALRRVGDARERLADDVLRRVVEALTKTLRPIIDEAVSDAALDGGDEMRAAWDDYSEAMRLMSNERVNRAACRAREGTT